MSVIESMDTMQAWTVGLRLAMGYPQYAPVGNPIAYASGGRKNFAEALEIAAIVEQTNRDFVLVAFDLPIADGPVGESLDRPAPRGVRQPRPRGSHCPYGPHSRRSSPQPRAPSAVRSGRKWPWPHRLRNRPCLPRTHSWSHRSSPARLRHPVW